MTFAELKEIINDISTGKMEYTEKLDGQNIQLSFDPYNNRVLYARNRGQQLKLGATLEEFKKQYGKDHPIYAPFVDAMESFQSIASTFGQKTQLAIFGDKKQRIFYNCEIIDARSSNVIKYDINSIIIHQTGHVVATAEDVYKMDDSNRVELLKSKLASSKDGYIRVSAPKKLDINIPAVGKQAIQKISSLQKLYNLKDSDTVGDYIFKETIEQIEEALPNLAIETYEKLAGKILGKDNTNIDKLIKSNEEMLANKVKVKEVYKRANKIYSNAIRSLELVINDFAMRALQNVESEFVKDPTAEKKRLQKEIDDTINTLKSISTDEGKEFIRKQLEKIDRDILSSTEGLVFSRGNKVFKITGAFAAINQLLGALKFGRRGFEINESSSNAYYWKNCTDFECGNEVQDIVDIDYLNYPKELYYHNPDNIVSKDEFSKYVPLSQWHPGTKTSKLFGYNFDRGIVFSYDPESDVHYFYIIKEVIGEKTETSFKTVSVVPGSFKPPHFGHFAMVKYYSEMSDVCYVIITDPKSQSSVRKSAKGKSISADTAKKVFEIYAKEYDISNVEFITTNKNPIEWVYDYIGKDAEIGTHVILGVSSAGNDAIRYVDAKKYVKPGITFEIKQFSPIGGENKMSASDFRNALDSNDPKKIYPFLPPKISKQAKQQIVKILFGS